MDRNDGVWVSSLNDRVQLFTPEGKFVRESAERERGRESSPGRTAWPDSKGNLYIADAGNQRIQKFAAPDLRP